MLDGCFVTIYVELYIFTRGFLGNMLPVVTAFEDWLVDAVNNHNLQSVSYGISIEYWMLLAKLWEY